MISNLSFGNKLLILHYHMGTLVYSTLFMGIICRDGTYKFMLIKSHGSNLSSSWIFSVITEPLIFYDLSILLPRQITIVSPGNIKIYLFRSAVEIPIKILFIFGYLLLKSPSKLAVNLPLDLLYIIH